MRTAKILLACVCAIGCASLLMAAKSDTVIKDDKIGIAKVSVEADSGLNEKPYAIQGKNPGEKNKRIPRAYDNAPPMIPHDISAFGEITKES